MSYHLYYTQVVVSSLAVNWIHLQQIILHNDLEFQVNIGLELKINHNQDDFRECSIVDGK